MNYSPRYGRFRALMRTIRQEAGLSQTALSEKLGTTQTFVSKSELGERRMDFLETVDFCKACGVSIDELMARLAGSSVERHQEKRKKRKSPRKMDKEGRLTEK